MEKLTHKQEIFCVEYIKTGNASEAYRNVYSCVNSKPETVHRSAKELLDNPKIATRIQEHYKQFEPSPEKIIQRLMQVQQFDIRKLYHSDGRQKLLHELDSDTAAAIGGVKHYSSGYIEYKVIHIKACSELIGRHLGLLKGEAIVDGDNVHTIQIEYV